MSLKLTLAAALFAVGTGAVGDAFAPVVVVLPVGIVTDDDRKVEVVKELEAVSRLDVADRDTDVEMLLPMLDAAEDKLDPTEEAAEEKLDAMLEICDDAALAADEAADTALEASDTDDSEAWD